MSEIQASNFICIPNPKYLYAPVVLAPAYAYLMGQTPFETGLAMTKIMVPISILVGLLIGIATRSKDDNSNLNWVLGLIATAGGVYSCATGWVGLGLLAFAKGAGPSFIANFF